MLLMLLLLVLLLLLLVLLLLVAAALWPHKTKVPAVWPHSQLPRLEVLMLQLLDAAAPGRSSPAY